jgi:ATP-dependent Zn protease
MRLKETANYLKNMELLKELNAKAPSGMLLYGKPGTGKTMMAKAFANYAQLPFIQTTPNELTSIDKETGKMQMASIFERAKEYAPAIIFIDEIDSFGDRTKGGNSQIINEFLKQMDGFEKNYDEPIFVLGATNHRQNIDSAILRPGRLDLHLEVPVLDKEGREYFIDKILENSCAKNISKEKLIMYTSGLTGAQIQKIGNESILCMLREGLSEVTEEILIEQINIEKYGQKITNKSILEELEETAYHEAGHAIIAKLLKPRAKIEQITITPRDRSLGFVSFDVESLGGNLSKSDIENEICVAYAGREAQMRFAGEMGFDTGASNDLKQATRMAYLYVARYGMDDEIGYLNIDGIPRKYSQLQDAYEMEGFMQDKIEQRVQELLKAQKNRTQKLIEDNWEHIEVLAKQLQDKEVLHEEEIYSLIEKL